tara:strand:- start:801 stop:1583 length:783 start_codon:yes stop_codon:yes gene_type:complete
MLGTYFYHERIRKTVALFGSLFTRIQIQRTTSSGGSYGQVRVPLSYAPRSKFLARIEAAKDLPGDESIAIKLPRMSFEMTAISYDSTRQLSKTNNTLVAGASGTSTGRSKIRQSTPYIINFSLNVYTNNQDDALQIVEQILPYFAPQYTVTIKPYKEHPSIKEDVPITLQSVSFINEFEGQQESRQYVQYVLDFEVKINFTGPIDEGKVITKALTEFEFEKGNKYLTTITTPDPSVIYYDSDFGFSETYDYEDIGSDDAG